MMKTTIATVALIAVTAQAAEVSTFYNPIDKLPTEASTPCASYTLKQVTQDKKNFASFLEEKADQTPTEEELAACVAAAKLVENTELNGCITTSATAAPTFNPKGGNALCQLSKGDTCVSTQVCKDSKCLSNGAATPKFTCTEANDVWSSEVKSQKDTFWPETQTGPASVAAKAWTDALAKVTECSVDGAITPATGFVSNKNLKQWTDYFVVSKPCNGKRSAVEKAFKAELKKTDVKGSNKITLESLKKTSSISDLNKCLDGDKYVCRAQAKDCSVIKCNPEVQCKDNKDCGTKKCKKGQDKVKVCSSSSITSAVFAVGAAALAAVAFF